MKKKENNLKVRRNFIVICVIACIIGIAVVTAVIEIKKNAETKVASVQGGETMQEQEKPQAITIGTRSRNTDNYNPDIVSEDGKEVPVPKGYVASPVEDERYVNGVTSKATWKKQEDVTFKTGDTYYLDQALTLASPEGETYAWTYNSTAGAYQSGNYQKASSTSTIETNEFTVGSSGEILRIVWSVCSQASENTDYVYYTITNTATGATIGGNATDSKIYGNYYGTSVGSLAYVNKDVELEAGTYKVTITYTKNSDKTHASLDRAYVKTVKLYSASGSSGETIQDVGNYAWSKNTSTGVWSSGNYHMPGTTSTIESNSFTVGAGEEAIVRLEWSVSCQSSYNTDYAYYEITKTGTGETIGGTSTATSGTSCGKAEASLGYVKKDIELGEGTYEIKVIYRKNLDSNNGGLDKAYVKGIGVYTKNASGAEIEVETREKSGGFVIYEKNAGETDAEAIAAIEGDIDVAQRTRNQYVWVPIEDVTDMYHTSGNGNQIYGNQYTFSASSYSKSTSKSLEPVLQTNSSAGNQYDYDQKYLKQYLEGISRNEFLQEMREEFYEMLESVKTYGGYYIGRYETGNTNKNNLRVVKGYTGTTSWENANNKINYITWYDAYKRSKAIRGTNPVHTGLIWGIQWDETLKWIIDTGEKTYAEVGADSTSWGNYYNAAFSYTATSGLTADGTGTVAGSSATKNTGNTIVPTGSSEHNKANNIYDLAGNMQEWSMECNVNSGYRYFRGGTNRRHWRWLTWRTDAQAAIQV